MSVILSGSTFVLHSLEVLLFAALNCNPFDCLIVVLPGSIRLDSPFNFDICWHFFKLDCSLAVGFIVINARKY